MKSFKLKLTLPLRAISAAMIFPLCALATPSITVDRVQQRYPWNGCVDIDYTIADLDGDPVDYRVELTATADGQALAITNTFPEAVCDLSATEGAHRVTWRAGADVRVSAASLKVSASIVYAPVTAATADYLVVDLSAGTAAGATYPIRCLKGDWPSSVFNSDLYKTERLVLKRVRAGTFLMGGNKVSGAAEHYVTISKDFFLGVFETTVHQYRLVTGTLPENQSYYDKKTGLLLPEHPDFELYGVGGVSIRDSLLTPTGFFALLCARTRYHGMPFSGFALPTESEWEYACRAGTTTAFFWGDDSSRDVVNQYAHYYISDKLTPAHTYRVGERLPNPWGFYDMTGNQWEWTASGYGTYPEGTEENPAVDPQGLPEGDPVKRGGSFWRQADYMKSANRTGPTNTTADYGFRILCRPE